MTKCVTQSAYGASWLSCSSDPGKLSVIGTGPTHGGVDRCKSNTEL